MPPRPLPARLYLWLTERLYHEFAWAYDAVAWLVSFGHWSAWRASVLEHLAGPRVLEIGFGTGELLIQLIQQGYHVTGLEPSLAMQGVTARKLCRLRLERLPRLRGMAQHLPFASQSFDSVIATFPAQYILEPRTFNEVWRVLRTPDPTLDLPGGRFVLVGVAGVRNSEQYLRRVGLAPAKPPGSTSPSAPWIITIVAPQIPGRSLPIFIFEKQAAIA